VAYGAQDVYLSGNPQITFFKVVYRRHTNFSMESIEQTFNGAADFGKKVTCTVSRNGDLIHRVYLQVDLPDVTVKEGSTFRWLNWLGHVLVKNVEVEIGGQRIDKHYGDWLHIWNELTQTAGHQLGYANMVGNVPTLTTPVVGGASTVVPGQQLFIPLQFWFCRNAGLALPLIALQYHEVRISLELNDLKNCFWSSAGSAQKVDPLKSASLFVDYIYLDTDERRRFAQASHEYLIEQLQFTGDESATATQTRLKLNFNHPTKELVWVVQKDANVDNSALMLQSGAQWFNYTDDADMTYAWAASSNVGTAFNLTTLNIIDPDTEASASNLAGTMPGVAAGGANLVHLPVTFEGGDNPVQLAKLQLNGHDRFSERSGRYFNLVQPFQHHENVPSRGINVYSFGLKPEEHQPSGTCNMSRIDNATLTLTLSNKTLTTAVGGGASASGAKVRVYAVSYNVLRIMSGMGGLAYSD
jgi:hypothetical protein